MLFRSYAVLPHASPRAQARIWSWLAASWPFEACGVPRIEAAREAVAAWRRLDDQRELYLALGRLAFAASETGNFDAAADAIAQAGRTEDPAWPSRLRGSFVALVSMVSAHRGDADGFRRSVRLELALAEQAGADFAAEFARYRLADAAAMAGDFDEAVTLGRAVVAEQRALLRKPRLHVALTNLCGALLMQGDLESAREAALESWPHMLLHGGIGFLLDYLTLFAARIGNPEEAAQMAGRAEAWYAVNRNAREPNEARAAQLARGLVQAAVGAAEFARLTAVGARLADAEIDALVHSILARPLAA